MQMTDNLKGLKEKMKLYVSASGNPGTDVYTIGAMDENARLQAIVLKEVGELVEALEFYAKIDFYTCGGHALGPNAYENFPILNEKGEIARRALAKFRGEK